MAKVRKPGDPWYTVLYREPYRFWWAPAAVTFTLLMAIHWSYGFGNDAVFRVATASGFSAIMLAMAGAKHWYRSRR